MNYIKKTAIFCLIAGLIIGTAQANMEDEIEGWLKSHNWHRMTIWGTKMSTQDLLVDGPLSVLLSGLGIFGIYFAFTKDDSAIERAGHFIKSPVIDGTVGCISLALGAAGLALIYHNTQAIQAENQ